jgi:hypothetical protein
MQQRGIRAKAIELLLDYGRERYVHDRGREIVFFDKAARRRLAKVSPEVLPEAERLCRTYAILGSDGGIVTVGHRYRRIQRQ